MTGPAGATGPSCVLCGYTTCFYALCSSCDAEHSVCVECSTQFDLVDFVKVRFSACPLALAVACAVMGDD